MPATRGCKVLKNLVLVDTCVWSRLAQPLDSGQLLLSGTRESGVSNATWLVQQPRHFPSCRETSTAQVSMGAESRHAFDARTPFRPRVRAWWDGPPGLRRQYDQRHHDGG